MAVTLYNTSVTVGTQGATGNAKVFNGGVSAATKTVATSFAYSLAVQIGHRVRGGPALQSIAAQVMFRAEVDPTTGGYAHPATLQDVEDEDMIFTDVIFPECISYGSTGSPRYLTDKAEVLSGSEQRETRYEYPRHEYSINMENLPPAEAAEVLNIWHICSGDFAAFLFLDPQDHTSNVSQKTVSGTEVNIGDQPVASAVGGVAEYPLYKFYTHGASNRKKRRRIGYPKADTLRVGVDGIEFFRWEYDYALRVLRFTKPQGPTTATVSKQGDVFTATTNAFRLLAAGDLVFIDGFTSATVNRTTGAPHRVLAVNQSGNEMRLQRYNGTTFNAATDEVSVTMSLQSALPPTGAAITAGFYFYVPVRFDEGDNANSEIIAGLRETAITTFSELKLREVFE